MKKAKVLHTTTSYLLGGGVENNIFQSLTRLKGDFEFHLVCGKELQINHFIDHPEVKVLKCDYLTKKINILQDLFTIIYFYRLIIREKYDIVHTHEAKDGLLVRIAAWLARCPCIIYGLHGVYFNDPMSRARRCLYLLIERLTMNMADMIISVGHDAVDIFHANKIGVDLPFYIVRSGIDVLDFFARGRLSNEEKQEFRRRYAIKDDDLVLMNVGRFSFSKGQRYTIQAFAECKKKIQNVKLILVGSGPFCGECREIAATLGVGNDVVFAGYQENIAAFLSIADVAVLSSLREGLPRVVVEAALMKIPSVSFDVEGASEVITDGYSGFIVQKYDVLTLESKITCLLKDATLRSNMGIRAHDRVVNEWDADIAGKKLKNIYERFCLLVN